MLVPEDLVYLWEFVCLCLYSCVCVLIDLTSKEILNMLGKYSMTA